MNKVDIRPLSVNRAWQGKRFKTPEYKAYHTAVTLMLPKMVIPAGPLRVEYEFGFSNQASDLDNPVKCFTDILQKKYGFNDSRIMAMSIVKTIVPKGKEYIKFEILAA